LKECLLEGKQNFACVNNPPKKLAIGGKTKLLSSQRVGHESKHPRVTWFKTSHNAIWKGEVLISTCVMAFKRIWQSSYWKQVISARMINAQHPNNARATIRTIEGRPNPLKEARIMV
jgi:hypothetical protein